MARKKGGSKGGSGRSWGREEGGLNNGREGRERERNSETIVSDAVVVPRISYFKKAITDSALPSDELTLTNGLARAFVEKHDLTNELARAFV